MWYVLAWCGGAFFFLLFWRCRCRLKYRQTPESQFKGKGGKRKREKRGSQDEEDDCTLELVLVMVKCRSGVPRAAAQLRLLPSSFDVLPKAASSKHYHRGKWSLISKKTLCHSSRTNPLNSLLTTATTTTTKTKTPIPTSRSLSSNMSDDEADPELLALLRAHILGQPAAAAEPETGVLEGAEYVYDNTIDVAVDMWSCKTAANAIYRQMQERAYSTATWAQHELHPKTQDEGTVAFIFTMDLLNFSFWSERPDDERFAVAYRGKTWTGYWSLVAALQRALDEGWLAFLLPCPSCLIFILYI